MIANDGTMLYVSGKEPEFEKRVINAYEVGIRRIEKSGERRRIFEYYGVPYTSVGGEQ